MLKRYFTNKPPKYELLPPPYTEIECPVSKTINTITRGEVDYIQLNMNTIKPMQILDYFIENGKDSHKDVFILFVKGNDNKNEQVFFNGVQQVPNNMFHEHDSYYLINRKVNITLKSPKFKSVKTSDKRYSLINIIIGPKIRISHINFVDDYNQAINHQPRKELKS